MGESREIASSCLGIRARSLSRTLTRIYDDALRPLGIKSTQFNILVAVDAFGPLAPGDIVHSLALEKSSLSRAAETMIARGWLRSDSVGGRATRLSATPAGTALVEAAYPAWRAAQARAQDLLGSEGSESLRKAALFPS